MAKKTEEEEELDKEIDEEDKEIEKAEKGDESQDVLVCPKCKRPVSEGDYDMDALSLMGTTSIASKINCPKCGYSGMPIEMSMKDYQKWIKSD
jgi:DNA-directed RNA polymerase subunit RPC12/RpoP